MNEQAAAMRAPTWKALTELHSAVTDLASHVKHLMEHEGSLARRNEIFAPIHTALNEAQEAIHRVRRGE